MDRIITQKVLNEVEFEDLLEGRSVQGIFLEEEHGEG